MQKDLKGPQADPYSPLGQRPKSRTRGVAPLPVKLPFPKRTGVSSGVKILGSPACSEPCLITLPGKKTLPSDTHPGHFHTVLKGQREGSWRLALHQLSLLGDG